ncbi:MAG: hypothetical protein DRG31_00025 [Deltaproteobacteria bacterium]|nr:MAG: hypothetical protein DRG31_00025 [Deltaproteobacteria bacterium]
MRVILLILVFVFGLMGMLAPHGHPEFSWQKLPIFDLVFGLLGCALLILFSEALGKYFLFRREDYYDEP